MRWLRTRVGLFSPDSNSLRTTLNSTFDYAYHFDASLYAAYLRRLAESRGVTRTEGKVQTVETNPQTGDIDALADGGGSRHDPGQQMIPGGCSDA